MPKLVAAVAPPNSLSSSCCCSSSVVVRRRLHPRSRSNPRQFFVSSRPRHDIPPYVWPSLSSSSSSSRPIFSQTRFKPSIADSLNSDSSENDHKPPDERILKLGKTLRTLSPLLPTILINPLPPHMLSPSVTLHLFPSTHPHLPTVKGRTLYRAALWAVPVAWSSVPLVGNVKLEILSERIVRASTLPNTDDTTPSKGTSANTTSQANGSGDERLVVRWRTEPPPSTSSTSSTNSPPPQDPDRDIQPQPQQQTQKVEGNGKEKSTSLSTSLGLGLNVLLGGHAPIFNLSQEDQFTGLFIFSFDEEGRVLTQTIEHAQGARGWERTAKFVTLTDWLIGKARGSLKERESDQGGLGEPGLAMCASSSSSSSSSSTTTTTTTTTTTGFSTSEGLEGSGGSTTASFVRGGVRS